jgi:hypothetical protein
MALHALPNDAPGGDIEGGKQRRRSIAFVVVRHSPGAPLLHLCLSAQRWRHNLGRSAGNAVLLGCTDDRAAMDKRERIRRDEVSTAAAAAAKKAL